MPWWGIIVLLLAVFICFVIIHALEKSKHPGRRSVFSMLLGLASLAAVNLTGVFTGISLPVSLLTILTSIIGGIPGVTALLFLNLYF